MNISSLKNQDKEMSLPEIGSSFAKLVETQREFIKQIGRIHSVCFGGAMASFLEKNEIIAKQMRFVSQLDGGVGGFVKDLRVNQSLFPGVYSDFKGLSVNKLGLGLNVEKLIGSGLNVKSVLKVDPISQRRTFYPVKPKETSIEMFIEIEASSRVSRRRKPVSRRIRPLASGEPQNPHYKDTNIGFKAILEYFDQSHNFECDDDDL